MSGNRIKARTESQIDELEAAEELKKAKAKPTNKSNALFEWDLDDEDEESSDETEEQEEVVIKKAIYFKDAGITMGAYSVESLTKAEEFVATLRGGRWEYNIVINKDMEKSMRYPIVDVKMTYLEEAYRDLKYDEILAELTEMGFSIKEI